MEEIHKTHKETTFGWVWAIERLIAAWKRQAEVPPAPVVGVCQGLPKGARYLAPR
ncbi:hypothetical protein [Caulobacter hibisci]|uniref:Uncharacterized protein n=1 Tax=Caulobacter hibisci TaxID=2035993 RepID=A0ABS0T4N8_9CAUL|nr:hypothetical protein [Caulobacter hibisci]MBI1686639.1 hypothetical protein [Caulobacter hibisci]